MRYVIAVVILTLIYALALVSFHPWDLATGAGASILLVLLFQEAVFRRQPVGPAGGGPSPLTRFLWFFPYSLAVVWDITIGTWQVLVVVLGLRRLESPGIVAVPIGDRSPQGLAVSGIATTLSPGTVLIDVDWQKGVMLVHAIDARDPDQVRANLQRMYDRYQRHVFP
jgi:multicomponent Na+:H+ antiporter subunit E